MIRAIMNNYLLSIIYNLALLVRALIRRITRPTEMGVRVLVVRNSEVLLIRHRGGRRPWSLPGGGVAPRETLDTAALREVREEAGCLITITTFHGMFHNFTQGFNNYIAVFVAQPRYDIRPPIGDLEIAEARFVPLDQLPAGLDPGSRRRIAEYLRSEHGLIGMW